MTTVNDVEMICSVCKKSSTQTIIGSSNNWGSSDLDTRPSEMLRSTIWLWIEECPHCGYVAGYIEDELKIDTDFLNSTEYMTCDGIDFKSELSERFYKLYLIERKTDDMRAFHAILHCAWACDDAHDESNSKHTRQLAVKMIDKILKSDDSGMDNLILIKADLLRRSDEFDLLIKEYEDLELDDEDSNKIIRFQVEKARQKDNGRYKFENVSGVDPNFGGMRIYI
ncbi:MAG: hypothetical protein BZ137_00800 [Methanosphaera sp. rholeuAM130]|nr:MAG: hypothetical protein BZ137_00800 [Methanosphaera sp. rholeuAM130]